MTFVLLALVAGCGLILFAELVRLGRSAQGSVDPTALEEEFSSVTRDAVIARISDQNDIEFQQTLNGVAPERRRQLQRGRRKVWRSALSDIRHDFRRAWSVCKLFAPLSSDPEFGTMLVQQMVSFYILYGLVWLRLVAFGHVDPRFQSLVNTVRTLRQSVREIVQTVPAHLLPADVA